MKLSEGARAYLIETFPARSEDMSFHDPPDAPPEAMFCPECDEQYMYPKSTCDECGCTLLCWDDYVERRNKHLCYFCKGEMKPCKYGYKCIKCGSEEWYNIGGELIHRTEPIVEVHDE